MVSVILKAFRLGKANYVEPVLAPLLAVMRTRQNTVDQPRPGVGRVIFQKRRDFLRSRRQPGEVVIKSPHQSSPVRTRSRSEVREFQVSKNERVDRSCDPLSIRVIDK